MENLGEGDSYMGEMLFFSYRGVIQCLGLSVHLKENLPVVNINYSLMTYNFKDKSKHLLYA